jgi:glycosyltransferase involved in cell wall biosynthesis
MNTDKPQITTIICTYRRPQLLRRAIESVLNQTYQDFQICVYDNASGDNTAAVVAEFSQRDHRVKYHCRPENIGLLANYSSAMKEVTTPFFSFLADDDVILPNFYDVALSGFIKEPKAFFSATSFMCLSMQGNKVGGDKFPTKVYCPPDGLFEFINTNTNPNLHGTLMRREVISDCGEFSTVTSWADRDLLFRIAAAHPVVLSAEEGLIFTVHNMDKGGRVTIDFAWEQRESIAASLQPTLSPADYQKVKAILTKETKASIYFLAIDLIYQGDFAGAKAGAARLRSKYKVYRDSFILDLLVSVFTVFPFILNFLRSVRDLRPYIKGQKEEFPVLSYAEIMDIYLNKKYN